MEISNGKDVVIAVCESSMGLQYPFFYMNLDTQDPRDFCEKFCHNAKWTLREVIVTGLKSPTSLSAAEMIKTFVKN